MLWLKYYTSTSIFIAFRHTIAFCEVEKPTTLEDHLGELETRARSILKYCGQNDKDKVENTVKNMCKYLERKLKLA